jgi:hypothetical protein
MCIRALVKIQHDASTCWTCVRPNADSRPSVGGRRAQGVLDRAADGARLTDQRDRVFWQAVMMAIVGTVEESLPLFRRAFAQDHNWGNTTSVGCHGSIRPTNA